MGPALGDLLSIVHLQIAKELYDVPDDLPPLPIIDCKGANPLDSYEKFCQSFTSVDPAEPRASQPSEQLQLTDKGRRASRCSRSRSPGAQDASEVPDGGEGSG